MRYATLELRRSLTTAGAAARMTEQEFESKAVPLNSKGLIFAVYRKGAGA